MKLKDYICFYMNCNVVIHSAHCDVTNTLSILGYDQGILRVMDNRNELPFLVNVDEVRLILKPLCELKEDTEISEGKDNTVEALLNEDMRIVSANYINGLRKRGYDVDGLIPAGLAICRS